MIALSPLPSALRAAPSAYLGERAGPGLAAICAWHDEIEPGSKAAAERHAHARGLRATHGICPACKARLLAQIKNPFTPILRALA